jgi:hypothetical protein
VAIASGGTRVPTGVTLPFMANPQFSSCSADVISCSDVQCSTVAISVTPPRLAIPTYVASELTVQPILPPIPPLYLVSR